MDACLINKTCHISALCHSLIASCYTTARISWLPQQYKKMLEQTCITDNEVCNFCHSSRSWKCQDFFVKTKTKTIFHILEAPQDQDQGLVTTSLKETHHRMGLTLCTAYGCDTQVREWKTPMGLTTCITHGVDWKWQKVTDHRMGLTFVYRPWAWHAR